MTLDEAIQHCEEVADEKEEDAILYHNCATHNQNLYEKGLAENTEKECRAGAEEHRQLAEWLKELKAYRNKSEIPTSCGDVISRREALNAITMAEVRWQAVDNVNKLPSVSPQQRTGRWIEHFDEIGKWYECNQCHTDWGGSVNYCPSCGTRMEVEDAD